MGHREPTVIAAMVKENLRGIGLLGPMKAEAIREALGRDVVEQVEDAIRIGRLPTAVDQRIFRAIFQHAGAEGVAKVIDHTIRTHLDQPLFRPMLLGVTHVYGLEPKPALAILCKGFNLVHRDNGTLSFVDRPGELGLELTGAEPSTVADRSYMLAYAGAFQTALRVAAPSGRVTVVDIDPDRGFARFACEI